MQSNQKVIKTSIGSCISILIRGFDYEV